MNAKTPNKPNHRTVLNENLQSIQELKAAKATIARQEKELTQIREQLKAANEQITRLQATTVPADPLEGMALGAGGLKE